MDVKLRLKVWIPTGKIISTAFTTHMHPAPKYVISNGCYIKFILIAGAIEGQSYEMIPTKKGKFLLMFQGYTYSQQNQSRNYYCSKKDVGCKARLKLDSNGKIISTAFTTHMHPAPKYVFSNGRYFILIAGSIEGQTYEMIPTNKGKFLIMFQGYTYSQARQTCNYYCSKKDMGCRARLKLDANGKILPTSFTLHIHDPPKYMISRGEILKAEFQTVFSTGYKYEFVQSQRGKRVMLVGGYTFRCQGASWVCSTKNPSCRAKLKVDKNLKIISLYNVHCHSPRYIKMILVGGYTFSKHRNSWVCSAKSRACRAKLKLDCHQNIVQIYNEHNHPSRYRVINGRTYQYKYEFVKSQMGKQLILIGGYTFAKLRPGPVWVCSTRKNGCKAKLILGTDQKILHLFNKHAHYPRYRVINGKNYRYEMVTSQRGKSLILFQGYTFSRVTNLRWSCSTHYPACKAILRLTKDKTVRDFTSHNHPSRKYIITNTGKNHHILHFSFRKHTYFQKLHNFCYIFPEIYYEWVLSQKGKRMIMVDGYTYSKKSQNGWVCSTRNAFCRARLRLNAEGLIIYIDDKHSHAPKNQFRIRYKKIRIYEIPKGEGFDSSGWVYVWSAKRELLGVLIRQESLQGEN
ncbi:hypothetical protein SFRURICE_014660 [Spodoptera frugiperda]|nr:hypothetical protein SFRURICE_014660 [Spodoptera frugiperda]